MTVRADLNISLDGYATTTGQTPEHPFGHDWGRLVDAYTVTRTFPERVLHDQSGDGTTGVDDRYAQAYFAEVGAEIMGAGMFGLHNFPADPDWRGWWGDQPPFLVPVFVLTHSKRPPIEMAGGTTFEFLSAAPVDVLARARDAAGGKDVRIGGGATVVRDFLKRDSLTASTSGSPQSCWVGASASGRTCENSSPAASSVPRSRSAASSTSLSTADHEIKVL